MSLNLRSIGTQALSVFLSVMVNLFAGAILLVGRESLLVLGLLVSKNPWLFRFLDKVYLFILGGAWLLFWIWVEGYFSRGLKDGTIWLRFLKVFAIELIVLFGAMILMAVKSESGVNWPLTLVSIAALAGGVEILVTLRRRSGLSTKGPSTESSKKNPPINEHQ